MPDSKDFKPPKTLRVLNLPFPQGRIMAIGDVHGCHEELVELIEKLDPQKQDYVIFLGDLVDRGPASEDVVQYVKNLQCSQVYSVVGNHDSKVTRYHYHVLQHQETPAYKIPMRCPWSYHGLSNDSLEFLNQMPHAVFMDNAGTEEPYPLCFVHAGLSPSLFHQEPNAFIRNRYFTKNVHDNRLTPVKSIEIDDVWCPLNSSP